MGALSSKASGKTIGTGDPKPWDSDVFAPQPPVTPAPESKKKKQQQPKSTINKAADRQLGVLEEEGY